MILLDTHALLWLVAEPQRLSKTAVRAIREAVDSDSVAIAAITLWELAWLARARRVVFVGTIDNFVARMTERVVVLPIDPKIAALAAGFPDRYPRDPADRLIGATALAEGIPLVTKDEHIRSSGLVQTIW